MTTNFELMDLKDILATLEVYEKRQAVIQHQLRFLAGLCEDQTTCRGMNEIADELNQLGHERHELHKIIAECSQHATEG